MVVRTRRGMNGNDRMWSIDPVDVRYSYPTGNLFDTCFELRVRNELLVGRLLIHLHTEREASACKVCNKSAPAHTNPAARDGPDGIKQLFGESRLHAPANDRRVDALKRDSYCFVEFALGDGV